MDVPNFPDVTKSAVPFFVLAMLLEILSIRYLEKKGKYETRDTFASLSMGVGSIVAGILFAFVKVNFFFWLYQYRVYTFGFSPFIILLCFCLDDMRYYWAHRFGHEYRWFWASHINHHSSQHYNLSTALRQTWTGTFTGLFVLQAPLIVLGFHPYLVFFVGGLNLLYQFWIHTEAIDKLPWWFEAIFNTPSHHRVHHASNPRYLDSNYAGTLIVWDKLFGTFVPETKKDLPRYGIVKNLATFHPIKIALHEYVGIGKDLLQSGLSWKQRFYYLFATPGYSHDASRKNSSQLKRDYLDLHPEEADQPGFLGKV
ncbi:MAG: sterol desaturase family protein [Spirochaetota bacterium]